MKRKERMINNEQKNISLVTLVWELREEMEYGKSYCVLIRELLSAPMRIIDTCEFIFRIPTSNCITEPLTANIIKFFSNLVVTARHKSFSTLLNGSTCHDSLQKLILNVLQNLKILSNAMYN